MTPSVGVVVLAYGDEPWLCEALDAIIASVGVLAEPFVVDNGAGAAVMNLVRQRDDITLIEPGHNTGFAGGCNLGASFVDHPYLAFVNSDCIVEPDTLSKLVAEADVPGVGLVMASVRMADDPAVVNSYGNPIHLLGTCWAGGLEQHEFRLDPYDVPAASGACLMVQRRVWSRLGGFDGEYFAYLEDTDLSLRCWQRGLSVRCVPTAIARHHYEFSRNSTKMYLLERNRLLLVSTLWSRRALIVLFPCLAVFEVAMIAYAAVNGWGGEKLRGWVWLWRHRTHLVVRRRVLQDECLVPPSIWMARLTPDFEPHVVGSPGIARAMNMAMRAYWSVARRLLERGTRRVSHPRSARDSTRAGIDDAASGE